MGEKHKILSVGGDMRSVYCAARLATEYDTSILGFDAEDIPHGSGLHICDASKKYDTLLLPVIPLDSDGMIPAENGSIDPEEAALLVDSRAEIFVGRMDARLRDIFPDARFTDYLSREDVCLKNAVPTAEGAVMIALSELPVTLSGLKILIVGMGRIGTALTEILKGFGADVTAAVRNEGGAARARLHGVKSVRTEEIGGEWGLIFNTVPMMIFDSDKLSKLRRDTLIIDLASKPGGVDLAEAESLNIKTIHALGLPGKTAPVTAGEIIAESIIDTLKKGGGGNV